MRFATSMPWEKEKSFTTGEERLLATRMTPIGEECLSLIIAHYNYDWPNLPNSRLIEIKLSGGIRVNHQFCSELVILELTFSKSSEVISCTVQWELFGQANDASITKSEFCAQHVSIDEIESAN